MLEEKYNEAYEEFLLKSAITLFYASNEYRKLLKSFLPIEDYYFIAVNEKREIVGALPSFLIRGKEMGNILNSLPFYGSNGSIIEYENNGKVKEALLGAFQQFGHNNNCISMTIITSPFEKDLDFYETNLKYDFRDQRIGLITRLPKNGPYLSDELMRLVHYKTRNIRKALKTGVTVACGGTHADFAFLAETHLMNMKAIGGIPKPYAFFEQIPLMLEYGKHYEIFTAYINGLRVAALLLFYFNKTVEYFTPVVLEEYRTFQPLSLIIFEAMKHAARKEFNWWNWGGTWSSQNGLYRFKKRWGTEEKPYFYYTKLIDTRILNVRKDELLNQYPYSYVLPFGRLKNEKSGDCSENDV